MQELIVASRNKGKVAEIKELLAALSDKTINIAFLLAFLLIFLEKFLSVFGPKIIPPPLQSGDLEEPALALPVPF